jgi:hypothetical protein
MMQTYKHYVIAVLVICLMKRTNWRQDTNMVLGRKAWMIFMPQIQIGTHQLVSVFFVKGKLGDMDRAAAAWFASGQKGPNPMAGTIKNVLNRNDYPILSRSRNGLL